MLTENKSALDTIEILKRIPHRYPFMLIDRVLSIDLEKGEITGIKNVTFNEPIFQGHFPSEPIMPGVFQIEAMAQLGGVYLYEKGFRGINVMASIKEAKFRKIVRPGDTLVIFARELHLSSRGGKMFGEIKVNGEKVAEAEMMFGILNRKSREE